MSNLLQVLLFNAEPESSHELRVQIESLNFVRLVSEVATPSALAQALSSGGVKLVFFHMDPDFDEVENIIDEVSTRYPELALIAISHQTDPAAILGPMRSGCDQFVCEPIDKVDLANAVARVASRRLSASTKSRCICVVAPRGGSGTTSIACNLALEIGHLSNRPCALVDLDLQFGDVAGNFDVEPKYTIFDLADAGQNLDRSIIESTMQELPCQVSVLARPEMVEQEEVITPDVIHRVIGLLTTVYENVVIDLPGRFNQRTIAALEQADLVLVVCQLQVPSIRNAKRYFDALVRFGVPAEKIEFVVNRSDGRAGRVTTKDVEEAVKKPVFACIPNDYQFVARSIDFGRPIAAMDRNSPVRAAIRKMATKIVSLGAEASKEVKSERGFLSRLLSK